MKIAEVGDIIEFKDGLRGMVEKVNDNSVIVDLTIMSNYRDLDLEEKTVVNHKRYKIVKSANDSNKNNFPFSFVIDDRGSFF